MGMASKTPNRLTPTVDEWTLGLVSRGLWLVGFYRNLGDGAQASLVTRVIGPGLERLNRLALATHLGELREKFLASFPAEEEREVAAWKEMVRCSAGLCAFAAMLEWGGSVQGVPTMQRQALGTFHRVLKGYRAQFPDDHVREGAFVAVDEAAIRCAETLGVDLVEDPLERETLQGELKMRIHEALRNEVLQTL